MYPRNRNTGGSGLGLYIVKNILEFHNFKYEIIEELGVLSESAKGWTKELNRISWNGGAPKLDVRDWAPEHEKMGKGVTLTDEEEKVLLELLQNNLK